MSVVLIVCNETGFLYLVKHFWILQDKDITIIIMVMVISKVGNKSIT